MKLRNILLFIFLLAPWFLSGLIPIDQAFYQSLEKPFFTPPTFSFGIIWTILYILITISVFLIVTKYPKQDLKDYYRYLFINYIANQAFTICFFVLKDTFAGFLSAVITLLSSLFLYYETKSLDKKASKFLIPYVYFSLFAVILSISIYFLNL